MFVQLGDSEYVFTENLLELLGEFPQAKVNYVKNEDSKSDALKSNYDSSQFEHSDENIEKSLRNKNNYASLSDLDQISINVIL